MARVAGALLAALAVMAGGAAVVARAGDDPPEPDGPSAPPAVDGIVLLPRGSTFAWLTAEAPRLPRQLGPTALAAIDLVQGRRSAGLPLAGEPPPDRPPPGWPLALPASAPRGPAPLGAAPAAEPCDCATRIGDTTERRVASVWALARFDAGERDLAELMVLDVRARYRDGIAVWLNGIEIARRSLPVAAPATALADRPHGPEWETFHVPVPQAVLRRTGNVVAAQVATSSASSAPVLDLELVGHRGVRVVRGPRLLHVGRDRATVAFDTDLPVRAGLEFGPTPSLGRRVSSGLLPRRHHVVELTGLAPGRYHYRVTAAASGGSHPLCAMPGGAAVCGGATGAGAVHSFHTAPAAGDIVRIAAYGDVRGGHQVHGALVAAMLGEAPDLVVATGDLVLRGSDEADWQRFFAVTADLLAEVPFYTAIGNHDLGVSGDSARSAVDLFGIDAHTAGPDRRFYAIDVADVHVAFLDSNAYGRRDQVEWLDADLAAARARGARALLVVTHDGPFSRGNHGGNPIAVRDYVPVMARHGVTLALSGHDHIYQRGTAQGIPYVVTGGGGASLYPISCGVSGRPPCTQEDGMAFAAREHHYAMLTVYPGKPGWLEMCPRRGDGTAVEPCVRYDLR